MSDPSARVGAARVGTRAQIAGAPADGPSARGGPPLLPRKFAVPEIASFTRQRVIDALQPTPPCRLILLTAPAGAGKTTALAELATGSPTETAWYQAEHTEADAPVLLAHLEHTLRRVVPDLDPTPWTDVVTAITALDAFEDRPPTLLLLDDLHELAETPAEATLERLILDLPSWLAIVATSRHEPGFNLPQLRVRGLAEEAPADVLRWRHWEVEQLFRDFFGAPLRPEDAARLTQRTEGWVAGLQLFHLASQRLPMHRRRALIHELHTRPGVVRDYLTRNVLENLPSDLHRFLVDTCVLGRLDADLCDGLRGSDDSAAHLAELTRRRLFTLPAEHGGGYRYHEVLRSYLEVSLLERDGARATRRRFTHAGALLEAAGDLPEALHAYARAEAWPEVHRLLGEGGPELSSGKRHLWLGRLPAALMASDPWLQLAEARALRAEGQWESAVSVYADAADAFGDAPAAAICHEERRRLLPWVEERARPAHAPTDLLRQAMRHDPLDVARRVTEADADGHTIHTLVAVTCLLLAGDVRAAKRRLATISVLDSEDELTEPLVDVLGHVIGLAGGEPPDPAALYATADVLEQLGAPWFSRLARHLGDVGHRIDDDEVDALLEISDAHGDRWGRGLVALSAGTAAVARRHPRRGWLTTAAEAFESLGAPVLEVWAWTWLAIAPPVGPDRDADAVERIRTLARQVDVPGAAAILELVTSQRAGDQAGIDAATAALARLGLAVPSVVNAPQVDDRWARASRTTSTSGAPAGPEVAPLATDSTGTGPAGTPNEGASTVTAPLVADRPTSWLTCFGAFVLIHDGRSVDVAGLKPQCRQTLGRLALHAGTPVRREQLLEDLWPAAESDTTRRKLQVLISTLRRSLEPDVTAGAWQLLRRTGEAYVLQIPAISDVQRFDAAIADARRAEQQRDAPAYHDALQRAFDSYAGDLLPELGSPDWLVTERDRYRTAFARVSQALVTASLAEEQVDVAISVAHDALQIVRYHSPIWRSLQRAYERSGDAVSAARVAEEHAEVLSELGQPTR